MSRNADPETYLRLACERLLLARHRNNGPQDSAEGGVISRACIAAGVLDQATARGVLDEYALATLLREHHRGFMHMRRRPPPRGERQRFSAQRVAVCDIEFQRGGEQCALERVIFADDATHLDLSGTDLTGQQENGRRRRGRMRPAPGMSPPQPFPQTLAIRDDQGTTASGHSGQGGWGGTWQSTYRTDVPLSPTTRWIEIDGTRIDLPERRPAPAVRVEEIEPMDPLRAMLYREILSTDRRHGGGDSVEVACRTLIAIGARREDDPLLLEIGRIATALANAAPVPGLSEPWASLLSRYSKADGPTGKVAIGTVVDDLEGFSIRFDELISEPTSFSISLAISPGSPLLRHFPWSDDEASPIIWWAEDDRKNAYVGFDDSGGGSDNLAEGHVTSLAPLDPKATELRLLPTASHTRGVIAVPLDALAARP